MTTENVYVRVYSSIFKSGLVAKLGANQFTTLVALASYMNENGECYPTQQQLADAVGVHKNTVNKYVNALLEFTIDGKPLVTRKKVNLGQGNVSSHYKIQPIAQIAKFNGSIENVSITNNSDPVSTTNSDPTITTNSDVIRINNNNQLNNNVKPLITNSNQAIKLFQQVYYETYGVHYTVSNYGKEGKIIRDKVIKAYPDMVEEIITTCVKQYDSMFKSFKYPRPSIMMFSWAVNQVLPLIEQERNLTEVAAAAPTLETEAEQKLLSKLSKLQ